MTRVLVTGGLGFIGRHLGAVLEAQGWTVSANRGDLTPRGHFDYIVNLAAETSIARSIERPEAAISASLGATLAALESARERPPRCFLHLATDEQYGDGNEFGTDWGRVAPRHPYAAAKIAQEAAVLAYWRTYALPVVIATADLVIGPGQPADKVVPTMAAAIRAGAPCPIFTRRHQPIVRRYTTIANLCDFLRFLLDQEYRDAGAPARVAVPGEMLSSRELAEMTAMLLDRTLIPEEIERPGVRSGALSVSGPGFARGWESVETFPEGLAAALRG